MHVHSQDETLLPATVRSDAGPSANDGLEVGATLGHFELLGRIGAGGMGSVWRARDLSLERDVALKALPADVMTHPDMKARFVREAQAQAHLSHPNVVPIYFIGESHGQSYFAMECVEGESLQDRIERGDLPGWVEALRLTEGVVLGLKHAAERGLVHRDVKPANIMVTREGIPKVADFGIAKRVEAGPSTGEAPEQISSALTQIGGFVGTANYAAPEQIRGDELDARSDMYALGVTLYEVLAGRRPFDDKTPMQALYHHLNSPPDLSHLPDGTPSAVVALVRRLLEKDAANRFSSYDELLGHLKKAMPRTEPAAHLSSRFLVGLLDMTVIWAIVQLALKLQPVTNKVYLSFLAAGLYLFVAALFGKTIGQLVAAHEVVANDTTPTSRRQHLARAACFGVALALAAAAFHLQIYLLYLVAGALPLVMLAWAGVSPDQRAVHDILTRTRVLQTSHRRSSE